MVDTISFMQLYLYASVFGSVIFCFAFRHFSSSQMLVVALRVQIYEKKHVFSRTISLPKIILHMYLYVQFFFIHFKNICFWVCILCFLTNKIQYKKFKKFKRKHNIILLVDQFLIHSDIAH